MLLLLLAAIAVGAEAAPDPKPQFPEISIQTTTPRSPEAEAKLAGAIGECKKRWEDEVRQGHQPTLAHVEYCLTLVFMERDLTYSVALVAKKTETPP